MNAREALHWMVKESGIMSCNDEAWPIAIRALRLLAAAEANDWTTPETDENCIQGMFIDADFSRLFERERNGLAARVEELEAFQLERQSSEYLDAERYRYLRDRADENSDGPIICSGLGDNFDFLRGAECDEEIDAARGSKP